MKHRLPPFSTLALSPRTRELVVLVATGAVVLVGCGRVPTPAPGLSATTAPVPSARVVTPSSSTPPAHTTGASIAATTRTPAAGTSSTPVGSASAQRATPHTSAPAASPSPVGPTGFWRSVFADEFDGRSLDLSRWRPNWLAGSDHQVTKPVNASELSCYDPSNVSVRGGSARLRVQKRSCIDNRGKGYGFASGMIESATKYEFSYGFAETRLFMPAGADNTCGPNWAAFWLNGPVPSVDGEIDIMECLSRNNVSWHYHTGTVDVGGTPATWDDTMPRTDGWHTFGVDWRPGVLDYYYDGVKVGTVTQGVTGTKHYLIVNLATSGSDVAEETLKVDYVRVWRRR